jgi:hypothetical protein
MSESIVVSILFNDLTFLFLVFCCQVTNDGQMDLFMNFACSCRYHSIPLDNIVVFGASK